MKGQLDVHHNRLDEHDNRLKRLEEDDVDVGDDPDEYSAAPVDDETGTQTSVDESVMRASSEATSSVISVAGGQLVL